MGSARGINLALLCHPYTSMFLIIVLFSLDKICFAPSITTPNNVSFHRFLLSSTSGSPAEEEMGAARKLDMTIKSLSSSMFIVIIVCRGIKVNLHKVGNHSNRGVGVVQFDPPPELVDCTAWTVPHLMFSNILITPNLR